MGKRRKKIPVLEEPLLPRPSLSDLFNKHKDLVDQAVEKVNEYTQDQIPQSGPDISERK